MAEYFSIPSREAAERFSEAYLDAQRSYYDSLEDRKEELFAAVRLLSKHCRESACYECELNTLCHNYEYGIGNSAPQYWPGPEEGGGEDGN